MSLPNRLPFDRDRSAPNLGAATDERPDPEAIMELLTVVAVAASAGARPREALRLAVSVASGPLASALLPAVAEIERGSDLVTALRRHPTADRSIERFHRTLVQAEVDGTSYAAAIDDLRNDVRRERLTDLEVAAQRLSVEIQFPLVLCILPAFIALALVPLVLATLGDLTI